MPLFSKKKGDQKSEKHKHTTSNNGSNSSFGKSKPSFPSSGNPGAAGTTDHFGEYTPADEMAQTKPKLIFHCQQAHGSPTASISGFSNVKELYGAIAEAFQMEPTEVRNCYLIQVLTVVYFIAVLYEGSWYLKQNIVLL